MIRFQLTPQAIETLKRTERLPVTALRAIAAALDKENWLTAGYIVQNKLSQKGQHTLGVESGRLRKSLRPSVAVSRARVAAQQVASSIGTNVEYAGVHEFGFHGEVAVKKHVRKGGIGDHFALGNKSVNRMQALRMGLLHESQVGDRAKASGHTLSRRKARLVASGFAIVQAHTRHMNIPARRPIGDGIEERSENYARAISKAIMGAFEGTA